MKRSGGSRSFRSLGSRMRAFGRSLMRHYVPPEEMPPLDMFGPGWQSAAEAPLMWPEAAASNAPGGADDQTAYFDAPEENIAPTAPRPRPAPARPAPAAPPPAQTPVQRKPAANKGVQVNPILYELLAKNDEREAQRKRIRDEKISAAEIQRQANPDAPPVRRRGRMGVNYIETGTLSQGDDAPPRSEKPAVSEPPAPPNQVSDINPVQRQPDDGAEIFEDWNTDDDVGGDDDDNGGTPPPVDLPPSPLPPSGTAQRLPDENVAFAGDDGSDFEVESDADYPQNIADVSVPPSAVESRRPQPVIQRDFQPNAPESVDDYGYEAAAPETDYLEAEVSALETFGDAGYEAAAPETFNQPPASQTVQRDYQPAASDVPNQASFQQPEFFDAPVVDGDYIEDGDTRPMAVQRAPVLPPPNFDDATDDYQAAAPADETGYDSLADWVDAHSDPAAPTAPTRVQRDYQSTPPVNFDVVDNGGAGDVEDGDTRPMAVQREAQPLPSPFDDSLDFEISDDGDYPHAAAPTRDVNANAVQHDLQPTTPEAQADDSPSERSDDSFTWSEDSKPPPVNVAQLQANHDAENFTDDTGDYDDAAPEYDENDEGDYTDFDAPEQRQDEMVYGEYRQPESGVQAVDTPATNALQRQPEAAYDDFAVENVEDFEAEATEYGAPDYGNPDETADDDFTAPGQGHDEGGYGEFSPPEADNVPDFAPPTNSVQRQPETAYDEPYAGEFFGEVEEYIPPVYGEEFEADSSGIGDYNPPQVDFQANNAPRQAVQRQPETAYDETYAAADAEEFFGEAEQYVAPVYDEAVATDSPDRSDYNPPDAAPTQAVQSQAETIYDEAYAEDAGEFDVNDYAAPVADGREFFPPTNTVQRQPDVPEMVDDQSFYGDSGVGEYVDDTGDIAPPTYHRRDDSRYGDAAEPDTAPPTNTVQRQPEASYDDDDDSSLYDSNYQPEYTEFVPAARNIDTPSTADPVQRSEQSGAFEPTNTRPPPFYGDDVYETDISALLGGQPDPRPVQRRAELPDIAPETYYEANAADSGDASVDLYQAMIQTGLVAPDGDATPDFGFDSHSEAAPPAIQRAADDQSASPPLDLFQAMMETGMVQAERDDDVYAADDDEPMSAATRMDLLSLLDTPPAAPRTNTQSVIENTSAQVYQPPQPSHMVQRALTDDTSEAPEEAEKDPGADVNVDQLARDVYSVLRNRLRIERERRDHNS